MKKILLTLSVSLAILAGAQNFSSGTISLGSSGMTVNLLTSPSQVQITVTGPDTSYLGIGFGSNGMANLSDGFIYNSTSNRDYTFLGIGATPSADASQDWTETSNTESGGIRTIVATRSLSGGSGDTPIPNSAGTVNIFYAKGPGTALSSGYHGSERGYASLIMASVLSTGESTLKNREVILYPNPAKETVALKNADKIRYVDIYDSTGRKISRAKLNNDNIDISYLQSGKYYLEIILNDKTVTFEQLIKE